MALIGDWIRRLRYLLRRGALEDELREEMEAHRALLDDPRAFGNTLRLRDEARDAWGWGWLDDLAQDTRFAWRTLRHSPGFTLTAVLTLALGIGVNTGMFSLVSGLLLRPLYDRPDEVVIVHGRSLSPSRAPRGLSYADYLDVRDGTAGTFATMGASSTVFVGLDTGEGARRTMAAAVTASFFEVLGVRPALGRPFTADEERPGSGARVAIVSDRIWRRDRGGTLGGTLRVNGRPFTVVGVAPEGFSGTGIPGPEIWLPLGAQDVLGPEAAGRALTREFHDLTVVGRLRPGASIASAGPALAKLSFPATDAGYTIVATPPSRLLFMPGPGSAVITASLTALLMVGPGIVLLVACLNLANLLLARGHIRRQELAIRSSLGGGRWRLTRQLLTEALLLALAGGAVGLVLSSWSTGALLASLRPLLPVEVTLPTLDPDWRILAGTVVFSLVASLIFGFAPARAATRRAVLMDLKHGGDAGQGPGGLKLGRALVLGQVALSLLLLETGGLFLMSAVSAVGADPGFNLDGGLLADLDVSLAGYDGARGRQVLLSLVERMKTVPEVESVTIASGFPFSGFNDSRDVAPAGAIDPPPGSVDAVFIAIGRDYARTLGLPMLGGRDFDEAEQTGASPEPVAMVDDALAGRLWPGESPLGRLIQFLDGAGPEKGRAMRIVAVVPAVKHSIGNPRPFPHVYVPLGLYDEGAMTLQLRVARGAERAMAGTIGRVIHDVDDRVPVLRVQTWREHLDAGLDVWFYQTGARVFSAFGAVALLLAVIGVYGVKSYVVSRRTREFGIRIATGAQPRTLLWQVMREGSRITLAGILLGLILALAAGRLLEGFLYGVDRAEPVVLVVAPLVLLAASLLASFLPARRATKVDPTIALRSE